MRNYLLVVALSTTCLTAAMSVHADSAPVESTSVNGKLFIDFTHIDFSNDDVKQPPSGIGLDVKRGYLVIGHTFDDLWSANVTTDFNYSSSDGETQIFVKKAYLQAKLSDAFFARAGSADMPWIPYVEESYPYRFVEKLLVDRAGFGTTADWGLHVGGKVANGIFNYAASAVNGGGYKVPTRTKGVDFEGRIGVVPVTGLTLAVGFYNGDLGLNTEGLATAAQPRGAERWDVFAGYVRTEFRVGVEYFQVKDWKILNSQASDKSDGYSGWAAFNINPSISVFARYDAVKPSKEVNPAKKDTYFNTGVAYKARRNVDLAFAYKNEKVDNGSFKTADVTLGTSTSMESSYSEVGFWAQVNF